MAHLLSRSFKWIVQCTYFPLVLINPAFILHAINTYASYASPPPPTMSQTRYPVLESIGPLPGSTPYLNMHADDSLCWRYTIFMVVVQYIAFDQVHENREKAKATKLEKKKSLKEKMRRAGRSEEEVDAAANGTQGGGIEHLVFVGKHAINKWMQEGKPRNGAAAKSWYE